MTGSGVTKKMNGRSFAYIDVKGVAGTKDDAFGHGGNVDARAGDSARSYGPHGPNRKSKSFLKNVRATAVEQHSCGRRGFTAESRRRTPQTYNIVSVAHEFATFP